MQDNIQIKPSEKPIQLHPQKIHLHIRQSNTNRIWCENDLKLLFQDDLQRFRIKYEQALDYPIDLYYLMDLTYSMKEHKEKLVELADSLCKFTNWTGWY